MSSDVQEVLGHYGGLSVQTVSVDIPGAINRVEHLFEGDSDIIRGFHRFLPPEYSYEVHRSNQPYPSTAGLITVSPGPHEASYHHQFQIPQHDSQARSTGDRFVFKQPMMPPNLTSVNVSMDARQGLRFSSPSKCLPSPNPMMGAVSPYSIGGGSSYSMQAEQAQVDVPPQSQLLNSGVRKGDNDSLMDATAMAVPSPIAASGTSVVSVERTKQEQFSAGADQPTNRTDLIKLMYPKSPITSSSTSATQTSQISSSSPQEPKPIECIPKRSCLRPSSSSPSLSTTNDDVSESAASVESSSEVQKEGLTKKEFLEKVGNFLTPCSDAYNSFILLVNLYNQKRISESECLHLIAPILAPAPELHTWFQKFLKHGDREVSLFCTSTTVKETAMDKPHETEECIEDIDYSSCPRYGESYCVVPEQMQRSSQESFVHPNDPISTLNNVYSSVPKFPENIRYVAPRRTQLEIFQNRIEEKRFEMDMIIESNLRTIEFFQDVDKQMSLMSPTARENFTLDESLGGTPSFLNERSVNGEKADCIIRGLKETPAVAVPLVLSRLQKKHVEWSDVRSDSQNHWRDELDVFQLKVFEQKANQFKQADLKSFNVNTLVSEIVSIYNKREKANKKLNETTPADGFHLTLVFQNQLMIHESLELLLYCVRQVPDLELGDMKIINTLIKHFIPGLLGHPHLEIMSDDDSDVESGPTSQSSKSKAVSSSQNRDTKNRRTLRRAKLSGEKSPTVKCNKDDIQMKEEHYRLFFGNSRWYAFFRLYHILCERLSQIYDLGKLNLSEDDLLGGTVTYQLGYRPKPIEDPIECYLRATDLVKDLINHEVDSEKYEERLRELFGTRAYIAFSMDKLIEATVMQLLSLRDEKWPPFVDIYYQFNEKRLSGQKLKDEEELNYLLAAKALISGENSLFKVVVTQNLVRTRDASIGKNPEYYKIEEKMTVISENPRPSEDDPKNSKSLLKDFRHAS
ncbi:unnamed protein product [Orchesella dallaii]|uniref:Histone deacetylase interacting domain-containing protein n=1 Tax=Orchesella dallaii TaxID=48710 RepID=A0ABP1R4I7_9HEXA